MTNSSSEKSINIENQQMTSQIFGKLDENIDLIEEKFHVNIMIREGKIKIYGKIEDIELVEKLIYNLMDIINMENTLDKQDLRYAMEMVLNGEESKIKGLLNQVICITAQGKSIKPKTLGQKRYIDSIKGNDIVFGIGPAGTGKTYLAMAMALQAFKNKEVNRIILTRPAVEAGENLGFLPGDLQEKVDPYLRPIFDALFEIIGYDNYVRYLERGLIEIAPLAYMRGRTLDYAYVILDEAQNTTDEQMKMFLTRLGFGSKAIITGDVTQIDLPKGKRSGLKTVADILQGVKGIDIVKMSKFDIVRHPLVGRIIEAYDEFENRE